MYPGCCRFFLNIGSSWGQNVFLHEHLAVHLNDYFTGLYTTGCNFGLEKFINYFLSKLSLLLPKPIFIDSREQLGFLNSQKAFRDLNAIITITKKVELLFYNPSYNCSFLCATTVIIGRESHFQVVTNVALAKNSAAPLRFFRHFHELCPH